MSADPRPPSVRARPRTPIERRFGAAPFGPVAGANVVGAVGGVASAVALFVAVLLAPAASSPGRPVSEPRRRQPPPAATWQPLADRLIAAALDGDTLIVAASVPDEAGRIRGGLDDAEVAALADAVANAAGGTGGPRLAAALAVPDTAAAAANRLAAPLAAGRVWVAWPMAGRDGTATPSATLGVPPDDPLRAWLDANGRAVAAARLGGAAAWALGAWEHAPTLDGGDYPPLVVPETLGDLELVGWSIAPSPLRAGRGARVRAAWRVGRNGAPDYRLEFTLLDARGEPAAALVEPRAVGAMPVSTWPAADIAVVPHDLRVPADVPPGSYDLAVNAVDPVTGRAAALGPGRVIGAVTVASP